MRKTPRRHTRLAGALLLALALPLAAQSPEATDETGDAAGTTESPADAAPPEQVEQFLSSFSAQ